MERPKTKPWLAGWVSTRMWQRSFVGVGFVGVTAKPLACIAMDFERSHHETDRPTDPATVLAWRECSAPKMWNALSTAIWQETLEPLSSQSPGGRVGRSTEEVLSSRPRSGHKTNRLLLDRAIAAHFVDIAYHAPLESMDSSKTNTLGSAGIAPR